MFVEDEGNGLLGDLIENNEIDRLNLTDKLIISYGIAAAMEFLHSHKISHNFLSPKILLLDSNFYPYLINFGNKTGSMQDASKTILSGDISKYIPPEMNNDTVLGEDEFFYADVFSYAMILFNFFEGESDMRKFASTKFRVQIKNGKRPQFSDSTLPAWKNLIEKCWDQDPYQRPSFTEICNLMESEDFVNTSVNIVAFDDYKKIIKPYRPSNNNQNK